MLALVGVVIGALATGWVSYWLDRRHDAATLRQAKRLVAINAFEIELDLRGVLPGAKWVVPRGFRFNTEAWHANEGTIARGLSEKDWQTVAVFFSNIDASQPPPGPIPKSERVPFRDFAKIAAQVDEILGGPPISKVTIHP